MSNSLELTHDEVGLVLCFRLQRITDLEAENARLLEESRKLRGEANQGVGARMGVFGLTSTYNGEDVADIVAERDRLREQLTIINRAVIGPKP